MIKNYVIGDIQGCYKGLKRALKKANFRPAKDKLWAVGDLVARGPDSLSTLEYLYDLGPHFETVLGNHDLHLIAAAYGISEPKPQDKLQPLIKSKHFSKYIDFLLKKPLAVQPMKDVLITHAGLYPKWSIDKAILLSQEVESILTGPKPEKLLSNMYGNIPNSWNKTLEGYARHRFIVNAFTRMRYLHHDYSLDFKNKSHPDHAGKEVLPWFLAYNPKLKAKHTLLFGHWAALLGDIPPQKPNPARIVALDTGFVWGNKLSLYCLENSKIIQFEE